MILIGVGLALTILAFLQYALQPENEKAFEPIRLVTDEWAPYTGQSLPEYGVVTAIVTKVMHDVGFQPTYEFMPWSSGMKLAAAGERDSDLRGTFPYIDSRRSDTETSERSSYFYFSDSILSIELTAFYNKITFPRGADIKHLPDLAKHKVILLKDYDYPRALKKVVAAPKESQKYTNIQAFQMLANQGGDLVVIEALEAGEQLLEQQLPDLASKIAMAPLRVDLDVRLMLSKRNPNNFSLLKKFNNMLASLKQNQWAFRSLVTGVKRRIEISRAVELQPKNGESILIAYKDTAKRQGIALPRGTLALVKQWDQSFLKLQSLPLRTSRAMFKVKVLNGPASLVNELMFVDADSVMLRISR